MNERIRELAGKALDEAVPETWTTLTAYELNKFVEKFASLVAADEALRQALAHPTYEFDCPRCGHCCQQRTWVGLDQHDIDVLFLNEDGVRFARYIEAKLKEKNT